MLLENQKEQLVLLRQIAASTQKENAEIVCLLGDAWRKMIKDLNISDVLKITDYVKRKTKKQIQLEPRILNCQNWL